MDEQKEKKIRDLKLRIMMTEKELHAAVGHIQLGVHLHAGHPKKLSKEAERLRERLEAKLSDLKSRLNELVPGSYETPKKSVKEKKMPYRKPPEQKAIAKVKPKPDPSKMGPKVAVANERKPSQKTRTKEEVYELSKPTTSSRVTKRLDPHLLKSKKEPGKPLAKPPTTGKKAAVKKETPTQKKTLPAGSKKSGAGPKKSATKKSAARPGSKKK